MYSGKTMVIYMPWLVRTGLPTTLQKHYPATHGLMFFRCLTLHLSRSLTTQIHQWLGMVKVQAGCEKIPSLLFLEHLVKLSKVSPKKVIVMSHIQPASDFYSSGSKTWSCRHLSSIFVISLVPVPKPFQSYRRLKQEVY